MKRFQTDFSSIILEEIALEGLDGITVEALCKRLSNNKDWPLKPVDDSIKKIIWSFVVCLKSIDFYRLQKPRDPLIIFNRFEYISTFGTLYEPTNVPKDIYPHRPIEDGSTVGSSQDYHTRFNLDKFPRQISVEEAEKRWGRRLVIVANQKVRTNMLIPEDKQSPSLKIPITYYLLLERIGRSRYLGEASFGTLSCKSILPDSKALSYVRSRLTDLGLIKNQAYAYSGRGTQMANRVVISSLPRFFIYRQANVDIMVSKIVDYLKSTPNLLASYEQVKTQCNISLAKTFKQPQLKKVCDTNLMLKYRELHPNATENEYLKKKNDPNSEKVVRCIRLKNIEDLHNTELEQKKITIEGGREFKIDCTLERQILRWIEQHGDLGVTLSDISRAFRSTTDGNLDGILKRLINFKYITKRYCDRGRTKVFSYVAIHSMNENDDNKIDDMSYIKFEEPMLLKDEHFNEVNDSDLKNTCNSVHANDNKEIENVLEVKMEEVPEAISLNEVDDSLMDISEEIINDTVFENDNELENLLGMKFEESLSEKNNLNEIYDSLMTEENNENMSVKNDSDQSQTNEDNSNTNEYDKHTGTCNNSTLDNESIIDQIFNIIPIQGENCSESNVEQTIVRTMNHGYCKSLYQNSKQTLSLTDRFYFRKEIIFSMLSSENIIGLIKLRKTIIATEKENPKFIGTLDIKTLIKIIGYFEQIGKLKTVKYRVSYENKTVCLTFVGTPDVDFTSQEAISHMDNSLNRFNNSLKTSKASEKWNLTVHKSPGPKIEIKSLKLPKFMKMRSLHEYLYYIVYDHPRESAFNACSEIEATVASYRNDLVRGDIIELPKVYYPSIGWKMFVPPLPKYPNYPDGWFYVSDIIHHMPLNLMLKIVNFNKAHLNIDKFLCYATHPVFKYLPLIALSKEVHHMLSQNFKKHIRSTLCVLRLLCTIGLIKFGEKTYQDTELIYAYLNRRASLLNTVKSKPNYYRISDMDYEKRTYEFVNSSEIETYWLDTWYFCTNTPLGYHSGHDIDKPSPLEIKRKTTLAIEKACVYRGTLEAVAEDDGTIPGDNKGAAGFDSHLFSHLARNWNLKKKSSTTQTTSSTTCSFSVNTTTTTNATSTSIVPITIDTTTTTTNFTSTSAIRRRNRLSLLLEQRNKKHNIKSKPENRKDRLYQIRYKWTPQEDRVLLFWKLGTMILKKVKSHAFLSYGIKDVVNSIFGKFYRSKSVDNYLRRIRFLMRFTMILKQVDRLHEELKADEEIRDKFKADIEKQLELHEAKKFKTMRDLIVMSIKQFITLLLARDTTIDTRCAMYRKKNTFDIKQESDCAKNDADFQEVQKIYNEAIIFQPDLTQEVQEDNRITLEDISVSVVSALIHSSLSNKSSNPRISLSYLQAFKQYPDGVLKQSFDTLKEGSIITCSQYHKESLQIVLSTAHIIQSNTYDYGPIFYKTIVGDTDIDRYRQAYLAYFGLKDNLFEQKMLVLYPSFGLCPVLTSLSLRNIVDLSVEFDKKYLEYMSDEYSEEGSEGLKNTLKRMRGRHFDLLSSNSESVEYIKIITSITKQLKNYKVICKLKQPLVNIEKEFNSVLELVFSRPTFEPQLESDVELSDLCVKILEFCKTKEENGASQIDIKKHFDGSSLAILNKSLIDLINRDLILRAGIEVPLYVHHMYADVWLVKLPNVCSQQTEEVKKEEDLSPYSSILVDNNSDANTTGPPLKKMRVEYQSEHSTIETLNRIKMRTWTRTDSTVNNKTLETYLNSVLSKIIFKPGITLKSLGKEYLHILSQMHVRELVEILETMKCINMIHMKNMVKPSFWSDPSPNHKIIFSNETGLEDNSTIMLEPTFDCEIRFGYFSDQFGDDVSKGPLIIPSKHEVN